MSMISFLVSFMCIRVLHVVLSLSLNIIVSSIRMSSAGIVDLVDQHPLGYLWKRVVETYQKENPTVSNEQAFETGPSPISVD